MKLYFECKLLSDIVLTSRSASEGFHPSLDYISGAKFLGILAGKLYDNKNPKRTLDLFHNGEVKFGDAHFAIDDAYSYHTPFDWFSDKTKKDKRIYLNHRLTKEIKEKQAEEALQLKQKRAGYLNAMGTKIAELDQLFSIKSAYDRDKRKSKDQEMYGYHALKSGAEFLFSVEVPNEDYGKLVIDGLVGKRRVGRSRTAEYGLLEIKKIDKFGELKSQDSKGNIAIVYAVSNLCFYDQYGFPTLNIQAKDLDIPEGKINWNLSQTRIKKYQSYNSKRKQVNEDRAVFEKGSVFIVETKEPLKAADYSEWVGALNNEGLGKVLLNPPFLFSENHWRNAADEIKQKRSPIFSFQKKGAVDDKILELINRRYDFVKMDSTLEEKVNAFFEKYKQEYKKGISKSQWGAIRGIAKAAGTPEKCCHLLFHKNDVEPKKSEGLLQRGVKESTWRVEFTNEEGERKSKLDHLENFAKSHTNSQTLLVKFASKMQKYLDENEK